MQTDKAISDWLSIKFKFTFENPTTLLNTMCTTTSTQMEMWKWRREGLSWAAAVCVMMPLKVGQSEQVVDVNCQEGNETGSEMRWAQK